MITGLTALLVVAALVITGLAFTSRAPNLTAQVLWWLFLAGIGALALGGAIVVAVKGHDYRLKTLAILTSLAVFGVSVLCVVVLAAGVTRTASRPAVSVTLEFKSAATSASDDYGEICGRSGGHVASGLVCAPRDREIVGHDERRALPGRVDRVDEPANATSRERGVRDIRRNRRCRECAIHLLDALPADNAVPWLRVIATLNMSATRRPTQGIIAA